jgi:hypothetical protein
VRDRFARDAAKLRTASNAALWAMEKHLKSVNREISEELRSLRSEIEKQFGLIASAASRLGGPYPAVRLSQGGAAAGFGLDV